MDVGDVERVADFVEAGGFAVVGKLRFDLQPRRREEVAQGVFVFVAVEAALRRTALAGDGVFLGRRERGRQTLHEGVQLGGFGPLLLFRRRHLAGLEAVVDLDPLGNIHAVPGLERERGQVQAAFLLHVVVAAGTVFVGERGRVEGGRGAQIGPGCGAENQRGEAGPAEGRFSAHASSKPFIVPVDEANRSDSMPMRWSIET